MAERVHKDLATAGGVQAKKLVVARVAAGELVVDSLRHAPRALDGDELAGLPAGPRETLAVDRDLEGSRARLDRRRVH